MLYHNRALSYLATDLLKFFVKGGEVDREGVLRASVAREERAARLKIRPSPVVSTETPGTGGSRARG